MKIIVCIKQVPGSGEVRLDPVTHTILREAAEAILNPFDAPALELAVQLAEAHPEMETIALSMGIPAAALLLRDAVARGIHRGVLLTHRDFAGADTLATSYTLAKGIATLGGADLILCGKMATDGDTAQIGPELAEQLGIPHLTDICELPALTHDHVRVRRRTDSGLQELQVRLPTLLCVLGDIADPRLPSLRGIRRSLSADIPAWGPADIAADPARCGLSGSPTQVTRTFLPHRASHAVTLGGGISEQAAAVASIIREVNPCRS